MIFFVYMIEVCKLIKLSVKVWLVLYIYYYLKKKGFVF